MKEVETPEPLPSEAMAYVNAVIAALTVLTGVSSDGLVSATEPFRPHESLATDEILVAAAAQSELTLSIYSSDPLIAEAAANLSSRVRPGSSSEKFVERIDGQIHQWVDLLDGKAPVLREIAHQLIAKGTMSIDEVAVLLAV